MCKFYRKKIKVIYLKVQIKKITEKSVKITEKCKIETKSVNFTIISVQITKTRSVLCGPNTIKLQTPES